MHAAILVMGGKNGVQKIALHIHIHIFLCLYRSVTNSRAERGHAQTEWATLNP